MLNLARMRYGQSVEFIRVPSITGQYTYDAVVGGSGAGRRVAAEGDCCSSWQHAHVAGFERAADGVNRIPGGGV